LTFFLEYIGEKATEEEIEEMIKMCDLDGNGYVTKDEFIKLASG
jgi:Ca2+-binding EF-hand superfamily protein